MKKLEHDTSFFASDENRMRNILTILLDLTNESQINKNYRIAHNDKHTQVEVFNISFLTSHTSFTFLFDELQEYRNAMCHLDTGRNKPYRYNSEPIQEDSQKTEAPSNNETNTLRRIV